MTCRECRDQLAAYADQALGDEQRERTAVHLVGCSACRDELAALREVRTLLARGGATVEEAPDDLCRRLLAIAGPQAGQELWLTGRDEVLPSPRRRRRNQVLFLLTASSAGVLGTLSAMVMMAPDVPLVRDPAAGLEPASVSRDGVASSVASVGTASAATASVPGSSTSVSEALMAAGAVLRANCPSGFTCPDELAGFRRSQVATLPSGTPPRTAVTYVASRGREVVVVEQRGELSREIDSCRAPHQAWQSGHTVFCVLGDADDVQRVEGALPHEGPAPHTTGERLREGWHAVSGSRG